MYAANDQVTPEYLDSVWEGAKEASLALLQGKLVDSNERLQAVMEPIGLTWEQINNFISGSIKTHGDTPARAAYVQDWLLEKFGDPELVHEVLKHHLMGSFARTLSDMVARNPKAGLADIPPYELQMLRGAMCEWEGIGVKQVDQCITRFLGECRKSVASLNGQGR